MESEGTRSLGIIGERLRQMFQQTVDAPLPPLILQVIRRLHEREEAEAAATDETLEPLKPIRWDLIVPDTTPSDPRN
jgi:hypothetical protein